MTIQNVPLSFYCSRLDAGENFKFLRFGDGEFHCYLGNDIIIGKNEHEVYPELTSKIKSIVNNLNPSHYNALQPYSLTIPAFASVIPDINWLNADVFHNASEAGELAPFFRSLQKRDVVLVSNWEKLKFNKSWGFIEVGSRNSFDEYHSVLEYINKDYKENIFLFAASRLSVPVIYDGPEDCTMIDIGSLLDPYIGRVTRGYHKRMTEEVIKRNLTL
jgi:hypothetical protein